MGISRQEARLITMQGRFFAHNGPVSALAQPVAGGWTRFLWKRALPVFVSGGLLAWVVWSVQPEKLLDAAGALDWPWLATLTALLVLGIYLWDSVCLRWLFSEPGRALRFTTALDARGRSYLFSAFNYHLGQGVLAWRLAHAVGTTLPAALTRCLLLAYHDLCVLLSFGFFAALWSEASGTRGIAQFCAAAIGILLLIGASVALLPRVWRRQLRESRWHFWPQDWSWLRSGQLLLLRYGYYGLMVVYAIVGLRHCGLGIETSAICGAVPCALLADGLPVSVSGLGTRETTLRYLLNPPDPAMLVAFSLLWTAGLILGKASIGLVHWAAAPLIGNFEGNA
jgi:hypothetical protein